MALKNCIRCGAIMFDLAKVCLKCREAEEEEYRLVTEFLRKHPGSSIPQIHDATGVKEAVIMSFIRRGRLVADGVALTCTSCGKEYSGSKTLMCPSCQAKIEKEMNKVVAEERKKAPDPDPARPPKRPPAPGGKDDAAFSTVRKTKM